ncbi:hypothetical protein [Pleurocapsa sp. CCALA 161]|uniref:hypothetical protein n=1 Tax=Pleurocapsa sp. CCALA 161 TaxID=2107688 RepID=UPI000D06FBF5|nr:hypothetical protein [Pleurocapsa sp. CCALA 161]
MIIGRQYNHELYRSTEAYLSEAAASRINLSGNPTRRGLWYYWLINPSYESTYDERLWVAEDQICLFDESHLISTEDIF